MNERLIYCPTHKGHFSVKTPGSALFRGKTSSKTNGNPPRRSGSSYFKSSTDATRITAKEPRSFTPISTMPPSKQVEALS